MVLQGRSVGGGTTVNWTSSFRTPERTLRAVGRAPRRARAGRGHAGPALRGRRGAADDRPRQPRRRQPQQPQALGGRRQAGLEARAHPPQRQGLRAPRLLRDGLPARRQAVGAHDLPGRRRRRRRRRLRRLPRARWSRPIAARARGVVAEVLDRESDRPRGRLVAYARRGVVLAGGAINTPALLLRSKAGTGSGQVGRRTFLHPTVPLIAFYDQPIEAFYGAAAVGGRPPLRRSRRARRLLLRDRARSTRCWPRWPSPASATRTARSSSGCRTRRRPSPC